MDHQFSSPMPTSRQEAHLILTLAWLSHPWHQKLWLTWVTTVATPAMGQGNKTMPWVNHKVTVQRNSSCFWALPTRVWKQQDAGGRLRLTFAGGVHNGFMTSPLWFGSWRFAVWRITLLWRETMSNDHTLSCFHSTLWIHWPPSKPNLSPDSLNIWPTFINLGEPPSQTGLNLKSLYPHCTQPCF